MGPVERVLKDAKIKKSDVDEVFHLSVLAIVVSADFLNLDCPRRWLHTHPESAATPQRIFQRKRAFESINPDEAIAYGANEDCWHRGAGG